MSDTTEAVAQIIAEAARKSDAAHWPEAAAIAVLAAGFGPVKEAKAEALDEAADDHSNPDFRMYLRARAAALRVVS